MLKDARRGRPPARRRVPARRHRPRVVRPRRAAVDPPPIAGASCASRSSRSSRRCSAGWSRAGRGSSGAAPRARRAARRDREPAGRAAAGVDLRDRDPLGARRGLQPGRSRRADRRRRSRVARRRAARRSRRPPRALPTDHLPRLRARPAPLAGAVSRASARSSSTWSGTARRSSPRCTTRPAAAIRARPSTRCGISSGKASSPTTRSTRCARSPARPSGARASRVEAAELPQPPRRAAVAEGRWSLVGDRAGAAGVADRVVDRARRSSSSRATAW